MRGVLFPVGLKTKRLFLPDAAREEALDFCKALGWLDTGFGMPPVLVYSKRTHL
jgi:hypothetical protein